MRIGIMLLVFACLLGCLGRGPASADPGPVGEYLMDQKISIFSFGMLRLELRLQEIQQELGAGSSLSSHYDWDQNRIRIVGVFENQTLTKTQCKWFIDQIKFQGGVYPDTGKAIIGDASMYAALFNDIGFEVKSKPEKLGERLDEIITIRANLLESTLANVSSAGSGLLSCESDLLSNRVMYSD